MAKKKKLKNKAIKKTSVDIVEEDKQSDEEIFKVDWKWHLKVLVVIYILLTIGFFAYVKAMNNLSKQYTEKGKVLLKFADTLKDSTNEKVSEYIEELRVDLNLTTNSLVKAQKMGIFTNEAKQSIKEISVKLDELKKVTEKKAVPDYMNELKASYLSELNSSLDLIKQIQARSNAGEKVVDDLMGLMKKLDKMMDVAAKIQGLFDYYAALDNAEDELQAAVSLDPKYDMPNYYLGKVYEKQKLIDLASEKYIKAIRLNPKGATAKKIFEYLKKEYEKDKTNKRSIYNMGMAYYRLGDNKKAIEFFDKVIKLDPAAKTFEGFLAKRRKEIIQNNINTFFVKVDDI